MASPIGPRPPQGALASQQPGRSPQPSSRPSPEPTAHPDAAPLAAAEFDHKAQVISMGFPLREATRYRYRDNWLEPREGEAEEYNHARVSRNGRLLRAHDGIDIYARRGEPVISTFDGVVIDPASRWQPWDPERYGLTAVIESTEVTSRGYAALLSHLDRLWVEPGQHVRRGEVIGTIGHTGNAEGGPPHLHLELRAPFELDWILLSEERTVDAFNPYPSLVAADPKPSD